MGASGRRASVDVALFMVNHQPGTVTTEGVPGPPARCAAQQRAGQNLLSARTQETRSNVTLVESEVRRSVVVKVSASF